LQIDRKPAEAEKSPGELAVRIADAQRLRLAADVDDEADVADDQLSAFGARSSRNSTGWVTAWPFKTTAASAAGSKRTARSSRTNRPSRPGAAAGRTMSFEAALPAVLTPDLSGCRPAIVTQSRR